VLFVVEFETHAQMIPLTAGRLSSSLSNGRLSFEPGEIHVWLLSARIDAGERAAYRAALSVEELERAHRYRFVMDQDRSIVGRGGLRQILAGYCKESPADLQFETGPHGKPELRHPSSEIRFNMSHAGDCVLIGVANGAECGVDIERQQSRVSGQKIAQRFFCPREVAWIGEDQARFTRLWTLKEAVIKALGHGLAMPLDAMDLVDIAAGEASQVLLQTPGVASQTLWLKELRLVDGYASSIAAIGAEFTARVI
jgi:4'-phosphopantetheinyl transferase